LEALKVSELSRDDAWKLMTEWTANENLRIGNLWEGIELYAALIARLGEEWR
jgi:hypothetical protein